MLATSANEIRLWEIENFNLLNEYSFSKPVNSFSVKPTSPIIASIVNKESINVINIDTNNITTYTDINEGKCSAYDSFGRFLCVGCLNGTVDTYDFKTNDLKRKNHKVTNSPINCLSWSKNDRYIATGSVNGSVALLNTVTNQYSKPLFLPNKTSIVTSIQYSYQTANNFAASYEDGNVVLWDSTKEKPVSFFKQHTCACTCVTLSPLNNILMISGGLDNLISCYDLSTKKCIKSLFVSGGVVALDLNRNGSTLAIGTANGCVQMYDLRSKTEESFYSFNAHDSTLYGLKFIYSTPSTSTSTEHSTLQQNYSDNNLASNRVGKLEEPSQTSGMKKSNSTAFDNLNEIIQQAQTTIKAARVPFNTSNNINSHESMDYSISSNSYQIYSPDITITKPESTALSANLGTSNRSTNNGFVLHRQQMHIDNVTPILTTAPTQIQNTEKPQNTMIQNTKLKSLDVNYPLKSKAGLFSPLNNDSANSNDTINNSNSVIRQSNLAMKIDDTNLVKQLFHKTPVRAPSQSATPPTPAVVDEALLNTPNDLIQNVQVMPNDNNTANFNLNAQNVSQLKDFIKDSIHDLRDQLMNEHMKFKMEMFREFMELKQEMQESIRAMSINDAVVSEVIRLREENKRLKKLF